MTKIMTAPEMTDGQIENVVSKLRDAMRKHRSEVPCDVAQQILGAENLGMILFAPFRERVEVVVNLIVRKVNVNRYRTPQAALDATCCVQSINCQVMDSMPKGVDDEVEVMFFKLDPHELNGGISDDDLKKEFELRGLKPADPISVAAVNEAEPTFVGKYPHGTHWRGANGKYCGVAFERWNGARHVYVDQGDREWGDRWWFAGVRK